MLKCGLLGKHLGHSYSPRIHSMLGDYEYKLYEKREEELEDFIVNGNWDGLNVTIPYKKAVVKYCSDISEAARRTGSVNTLVKHVDGNIYGDNTDVYGFSCLLDKNDVALKGKKALVLGNGGASASVQSVLRERGADVVVISRSGEFNYDNLNLNYDAKIIVNTTPVGMYPDNYSCVLDLENFTQCEAVMDIIYNPRRTSLTLQAEKLGVRNDTGLYMLAAQAVGSSMRFTGCEIQADVIEKIEKKLSSQMQNIILIGMPGCGKSTIAAELGRMTGRKVTELDVSIAEKTGYSPEEYIKTFGEKKFRHSESEVIREAGKSSGIIISTGGGAVTVPENYAPLHQNGVIYWIKRDIEKLAVKGRPLSEKKGVGLLYEQRKELYESFADIVIENNGNPQDAARQIAQLHADRKAQSE